MPTEKHKQAIEILRVFYEVYERHPGMRVLVKKLQAAGIIESTQGLYILFGEYPLRTMSQLAGLPKPPHCV
jgi:TusE/DsrC/DsvC family sulfur relay protein